MKIVRLLSIFALIFCIVKTLFKPPFKYELPLLLFPEKKAWLSYNFNQDSECILDDRPLCSQTLFNFSVLNTFLLPKTSELLTFFESKLIKGMHILGDRDYQLKVEGSQKTKKLIWPCRHIKPIIPKLEFSIEKDAEEICHFTVPWMGNLPGKNTFYSISDKNGWTHFIYSEKSWPVIKLFVQKGFVPLGISKIHQN